MNPWFLDSHFSRRGPHPRGRGFPLPDPSARQGPLSWRRALARPRPAPYFVLNRLVLPRFPRDVRPWAKVSMGARGLGWRRPAPALMFRVLSRPGGKGKYGQLTSVWDFLWGVRGRVVRTLFSAGGPHPAPDPGPVGRFLRPRYRGWGCGLSVFNLLTQCLIVWVPDGPWGCGGAAVRGLGR